MNRYTLIDGAFFERFCRSLERKTGFEIFENLNWQRMAAQSNRLIYYDALPVKKAGQSDEQFAAEESKKIAWLDTIRSSPDCHVRDGLTRLRTEKRKSEISQRREQKGVDTWIAVDAMQYALNGVVDELIIFTSDLDLYPMFEALQLTKCKGRLRYQEGKAASELIHSADVAEPITLSQCIEWCRPLKFSTIEELGAAREYHGDVIVEGKDRHGYRCILTQVEGDESYYGWADDRNGGWYGYRAQNALQVIDRLRQNGGSIGYHSAPGILN